MEDKAGMDGGNSPGQLPTVAGAELPSSSFKDILYGKCSEILQHNLKSMKGCLRAITLSLAPLF